MLTPHVFARSATTVANIEKALSNTNFKTVPTYLQFVFETIPGMKQKHEQSRFSQQARLAALMKALFLLISHLLNEH